MATLKDAVQAVGGEAEAIKILVGSVDKKVKDKARRVTKAAEYKEFLAYKAGKK